jgi:hypothetical protein
MSQSSLEERVAELERQVGVLLSKSPGPGGAKSWRRTRGAFTGDDLMMLIFEEGRKIRAAERPRTQPGRRKRRPSSS